MRIEQRVRVQTNERGPLAACNKGPRTGANRDGDPRARRRGGTGDEPRSLSILQIIC